MKCSFCYADNLPSHSICSECGESVAPLRICSGGHLLPPDSSECSVCPFLWPEVEPFDGEPILRGVLWTESARLCGRDGEPIPLLELRDRGEPVGLLLEGRRKMTLVGPDQTSASVRFLIRPDGLQYCLSPELRRSSGSNPEVAYEDVSESGLVHVGSAQVRVARFDVPKWVENKGR